MNNIDTELPFSMYREVGEGRLINTHCHSYAMELVQVTNGKIRAQIGTEYIEAVKGDFLYIPPTMIFRAESVDGVSAVRGLIFNSSILSLKSTKVYSSASFAVIKNVPRGAIPGSLYSLTLYAGGVRRIYGKGRMLQATNKSKHIPYDDSAFALLLRQSRRA